MPLVRVAAAILAIAVLCLLVADCATVGAPRNAETTPESHVCTAPPDPTESRFCAGCHAAIYAEHRQNTHGRAFFDGEARLATRGFRREDCIRCHTPRPVAETGIGMTPMQRWTNLDEGNTCFSCHGKAGFDYSKFRGGADCKGAFDDRVGTVEHCSTCHRIAGTPDQWSRAEHGSTEGRVCIDCHMPLVDRAVAEGGPVRSVRSHEFPASRSESQLRRAYRYEVAIEGSEVVVRITNKGVGHNFPTANRQRAVESLVIVRDAEGAELGRSRLVCRYPYALELEPHQLTPPVSTQIPSGKTREHRVPLGVAAGSVECRLYFKLYRPIDDDDPVLSRCLEERRLPFAGITPSDQPVADAPLLGFPVPASDLHDFFDPAGKANVLRGQPDGKPLQLPEGRTEEERLRLVSLLESHLPEARKLAKERLVALGAEAFPELTRALCHWSNETYNGAKEVFARIGPPSVPALVAALQSDQLYVRVHAREVLAELALPDERLAIRAWLLQALAMPNPLDRRSAAQVLGVLGDETAAAPLRALVADADEDVVIAAARALAQLDDHEAVPALERALLGARYAETRRELAVALAQLGSAAGIPALLDGLDAADELMRELSFASFFAVTGVHLGYEAGAPDGDRLDALARLRTWWASRGGTRALRRPPVVNAKLHARSWQLVERLAGGTDTSEGGDDAAIVEELVAMGNAALPALIEGLTFPPGFADKRALVCQVLGRIGHADAAPFLAAALRDPTPTVTEWACWALERTGDAATLPQLRAWERRAPALVGRAPSGGDDCPADRLLAEGARARLVLGDSRAKGDLTNLLLSSSALARRTAIAALMQQFGDARGYDADAAPAERHAAAQRWRE